MEDKIRERKEQIKNFLIKNYNYIQYLALAVIIWIGAYIRSRNLEILKDVTTGKYISLELDSTLFLRYAEYIAEHGKLNAVDMMRSFPFGADISGLAKFTSYFVAYLYKILHFFSSTITVAYTNNIYPIVATAIMTIFMFLLLRRLYDYKAGLVATLILNVMPSFLFRSLGGSSDHDILGMLFIFMAFYFYTLGWQSTKRRFNIIFGAIAGCATGMGLFTAGSSSFIFVVIGIFSLIEIFLNKFEKKDYYTLFSWLAVSSIILEFRSDVSLIVLFFSVSTGTAYFALLASTINYFVFKKNFLRKLKERYEKYLTKMPEGATSFAIALFVAIIASISLAGPKFIIGKLGEIRDILFKSFSLTRWALTVAENKRPYVADWIGSYGTLYVYLFIFGTILIFYHAVKSLKSAKKLTGLYALFVLGYIFSRYSSNSEFNGETGLAKLVFFGSIIIFAGVVIYGYLRMYYKKHEDFENIVKIDKRHVFLLVWFLVFVFAATSAIRFLFELSVIVSIFSAIVLVYIFSYLSEKNTFYYKAIGILFIVLVLFSPFSFAKGLVLADYDRSLGQARVSGAGYSQQWQYAGKWVRENTPENAGFIHWWDYGYWVQSGFRRPTVSDGGNFFGWWNYLTARHLLTAQNEDEPLKFLKSHNVSYFLAVSDEIGKYPAYSSIGSNENYDRYAFISTFVLNPSLTEEKRNQTILAYTGGHPLDEDLVINGKVLPAGSAGVGAVLLPIKTSSDGRVAEQVSQPIAAVIYQNQRYDLPMRCIYLDKLYEFEDYQLDSCLRIIPVISDGGNVNQLGGGLFLTKRVNNGLFARFYILNHKSKHFDLVYDDSDKVPLAFYQGRIIGPTRIWKVNYPDDLQIIEEEYKYYTRTDYPDIRLTKPA